MQWKKGEQCRLYFNVRIAPGVRMGCTGVRNFHIYYTRLLANLFGSSLKVLMQEILANSSALGIQLFDKHIFCDMIVIVHQSQSGKRRSHRP